MEAIRKLQPNRTIQLRACDDRGAAAAITGATESGFTVSGIFRDLADVCVLELWNADNYYEHPRLKYLPDFDFSGVALSFSVAYTGLQPLDSSWYPYADWPYLTVVYLDGTTERPKLASYTSGGVVSIDFSKLAQPAAVRQVWLTFVPAINKDGPQQSVEWSAVFIGWTVTGDKCALKVAGPGSVRIEETDRACSYEGTGWTVESGFYSQGFAKRSDATGDAVTIRYTCQRQHDLWLGTHLGPDRGSVSVVLDGHAEASLDCYLSDSVVTRRRVASDLAAGEHTVTITHTVGGPVYFDFLEAAVPSDVPDALPTKPGLSPALDYDTDHCYKLPPARVMWALDQLGYRAPLNLYAGVFFWNQRKRVGGDVQRSTVTFSGTPETGAAATLIFGDLRLAATDVSSVSAIAGSFATTLNATSTVFWAEASGGVLTLHGRSTGRNWRIAVSCETAGGIAATVVNENLWFTTGQWQVDPDQTPVLSRAARDWFADLFALCAAADLEVTVALSMELFNTPDAPGNVWAARFPSGTKVLTSTGFGTESPCGIKSVQYGSPVVLEVPKHDYDTGDLINVLGVPGVSATTQWPVTKVDADHFSLNGSTATGEYSGGGTAYRNLRTTHCSFVAAMRDYQICAFREFADLMTSAGLAPRLQSGEFCWWYFTDGSGMAFSDAETQTAAQVMLGRALHVFTGADDDPATNQADADFLRARLVEHMAAIRAAVLEAQFEALLPLDVNYPEVYGRYSLGGKLLHYINVPDEFRDPATAPFDAVKMEGLDFGSASRDLNKARRAARFPFDEMEWPREKCRYLMPVFNGGCPWEAEAQQALASGIDVVLWAWDHVNLFGWEPHPPAGAQWL